MVSLPIGEGFCERFRVEKNSRNTGRILYRNDAGEEKTYNVKVGGKACQDLAVLKACAKLLNKHLPSVSLAENESLRIKEKGIKKVTTPKEKEYLVVKNAEFTQSFSRVVQVAKKAPALQQPSVLVSPQPPRAVIKTDLERLKELKDKEQEVEFYRICASQISYEEWQAGEEIGYKGYKVDQVFTNERGVRVVVLASSQKDAAPVLCFRGTSNLQNVADDLSAHIGEYGLEHSKAVIGNMMINLFERYKLPVVLTGHSLGGAHAQLIGAEFADVTSDDKPLVGTICHVNAPGIAKGVAEKFEESRGKITVISVRHHGDVVYHMGGKHLKATEVYKYTNAGRTGVLKAHSIQQLQENMKVKTTSGKRFMHKVVRQVLEPIRRGIVGKAAFLAAKALAPKSPTKKPVRVDSLGDSYSLKGVQKENQAVTNALAEQQVALEKTEASGGKGGFKKATVVVDGKEYKLFLKPIDSYEFSNYKFIQDVCEGNEGNSILEYMPRIYGRFGDYMIMEDLTAGGWKQMADLKMSAGGQSDTDELTYTNRPKGFLEDQVMQLQNRNALQFLFLDKNKVKRTLNALEGSEKLFAESLQNLPNEALESLIAQFEELDTLLKDSPVAFIGASIFLFISEDGRQVKVLLADPAHCIAHPRAATADTNVYIASDESKFTERLKCNSSAIKTMAAVVKTVKARNK